jgi:hypothetical protein
MSEPMGIPGPAVKEFIDARAAELSLNDYWILGVFQTAARFGDPFRFDEERRFLLRSELDAAFFHLFLPADKNGDWRPVANETVEDLIGLKASFSTPRNAVAYIMDTFPIVRRKDEEKWGEYRTARVILEVYDAMQDAIRTGQPYQTCLNPPPADPRCCHPSRKANKRWAA